MYKPEETFINPDGSNYRKSEKIDLDLVAKYFQSKDYKIIKISQPWRHVTAIMERNQKKYFLKLASTQGVGVLTKNEPEFNYGMQNVIKSQTDFNLFLLPKVYETGNLEGLFYYICDYIEGEIIASKRTAKVKPNLGLLTDQILHNIASINKFLYSNSNKFQLTKDIEFIEDKALFDREKQAYIEKSKNWYTSEVQNIIDLSINLNLIKNYKEKIYFGLNHGDFTPWQFILSNNSLYLLDCEHATNFKLLYYDVVYFYHRTYTGLESPDIAKKYLNYFISICNFNPEDYQIFIKQFNYILALRIVGGFMDATIDDISDLKYHYQIQQDWLDSLTI
jgi:hypothetical protein